MSEQPMILDGPTAEDLKPSPEESALIQELIDWQASSAKAPLHYER